MSIQKKSLISTLKTAKKANVASSETESKGSKVASMRLVQTKGLKSSVVSTKNIRAKEVISAKSHSSTRLL